MSNNNRMKGKTYATSASEKADMASTGKQGGTATTGSNKFKMEVDLAALNGRVHFADDEKFSLPSGRHHHHVNESAKSIATMNASGSGAVSSYMS